MTMNKLTCHGKPKGFIHFMPKASEKKRLAKQESTDKERSPYEVQFAREKHALGNSVVHSPSHSPLILTCAALNNGAMAATNALRRRSPSRFCYHFFSFTFFFLFFFPFPF